MKATHGDVSTIYNATGSSEFVLICEHASNKIPRKYKSLGLSLSDLNTHIAWDIGAADLAKYLAQQLDAPSIHFNFSRLVVDCNRMPDDLTVIPSVLDDVIVPGNVNISAHERSHRLGRFFFPYHEDIATLIRRRLSFGIRSILVAVHTFSPVYGGAMRPWHLGVLYDGVDAELPLAVLHALRAGTDFVVGDNQPYSGCELKSYTFKYHGAKHGLPHFAFECRNDLVSDELGVRRLGKVLITTLATLPIRTLR